MRKRKKILLLILVLAGVLGTIYFFTLVVPQNNSQNQNGELNGEKTNVISPFADFLRKPQGATEKKLSPEEELKAKSVYKDKDILNLALLGIDRRSRTELSYRTDIVILLTINTKDNKVVMTSLPRDLWVQGGRINALYIQQGWETLQKAMEEITGFKPEKFILTDFKDFSWVVDAMGGVPVTVETTFTDSQYPVDETFEYQTISFVQGPELLTGERALIYARSRKGDNDNGDWGRMKRQHNILKGMVPAVMQPKSLFNPMVIEEAFKMLTTDKMDTNLGLGDAYYLWDLYKDKDTYTYSSVILDYNYVYTPPMEEYGGAWVLAPINNSYDLFQQRMRAEVYSLPMAPATTTETGTTELAPTPTPATAQ